ncbi:hypothetical protein, partial [Stenotrophomonas sepilia]|uniref:hypothetical protein n=1 Tax=Stenotrophomonas sepilia TaxID=2860290 RepID=UPI002E776E4F
MIDGLCGVKVSNLLPSEQFQVKSDGEYHSLNRSATPVLIEYAGHRIMIGSDAEADQLISAIEQNGVTAALYIASSHGRPTHNDASALQALSPTFICLTDSFEGSDFTEHYRKAVRWTVIDGLCGVKVSNLLPSEQFQVKSDGEYHSLNRSATPVLIEYAGHRIMIGSDAEADQLISAIEQNGVTAALYIASSHGRPTHNDASALQALSPTFICLTDSFEGSDFTEHYRKAV